MDGNLEYAFEKNRAKDECAHIGERKKGSDTSKQAALLPQSRATPHTVAVQSMR